MKQPYYVSLEEARQILAQLGIDLTARQMKRATDKDSEGRRKLPSLSIPSTALSRSRGDADQHLHKTPDCSRAQLQAVALAVQHFLAP